jgi:putative flippase GtrA
MKKQTKLRLLLLAAIAMLMIAFVLNRYWTFQEATETDACVDHGGKFDYSIGSCVQK